jgi:hypothetical protein
MNAHWPGSFCFVSMDLWLRKDTGREGGGTDDAPLCTQRKETTWLHEEPGKSSNGGLLFRDRRFCGERSTMSSGWRQQWVCSLDGAGLNYLISEGNGPGCCLGATVRLRSGHSHGRMKEMDRALYMGSRSCEVQRATSRLWTSDVP